MNDVRQRLMKCFALVFPELSPAAIEQASYSTVAKWDSVAAITLLTVIEEEFGAAIDLELLPELNSFAAFEAHLGKCSTRGAS